MSRLPEALTDGHDDSLVSRLASKELLLPAATTAATAAVATIAKHKAPELKLGGGGLDAIGKAASKVIPGTGGGAHKKTRRLPIQRWTDVAVPVEVAFERWADLEAFPRFMHRVLDVDRQGKTVRWNEKIWFSTRQWQGKITDWRENDRIAWKTVSGTSHSGVVSFHRLDDKLTRVLVTVEFEPAGMIEKLASGLRFVKRAVQADLARFKAYVEFADANGIEYRSGGDEAEQQRQRGEERRNGRRTTGANGADPARRDAQRSEREARRRERREARQTR